MASYSWTSGKSGDWNTVADWTPATVPNDAAADVTIDALAPTGASYTVTIASGETQTVHTLTMNGVNNFDGANSSPYNAAELDIDGTLTFAAGSDTATNGLLDGSLQTFIVMNNGTMVNPGTINGFIFGQGDVLLTGTNGVYITNALQANGGVVTIDTKSIAEMSGNTLFDGIFQSVGAGAAVNLGGKLQGLVVNIGTIEGPQLNTSGWTELTFNDPDSSINEWNGTTYVGVESTLTEIDGGGTVDVLGGRDYTTTNTLTITHVGVSDGAGMLNLQAGKVTTGGININDGIVQGFGTIVGNVANNGTLMAVGGTMDLTGTLSGTGQVLFDHDLQNGGSLSATGATLIVNAVAAGQTIMMNGSDTLEITAPSAFAGTIQANVGDHIMLDGVTATGATLNNGTLVVMNGTDTVASLALTGTYAGDYFAVSGSTVTVATGNVDPTISGTTAGHAVTDASTTTPFSGVTIADPNVGQTETVTVTLSAPGNGTLSNLGGGSYDAATGVYTTTGTAAQVTAALDGLVFTPTAHQLASGGTVTTDFTISVLDSAGGSASDTTTTVVTTAASGELAITQTAASIAVLDETATSPFTGLTISDTNGQNVDTLTVTLAGAAAGTLSNLGAGTFDPATGVYTITGKASDLTTALQGLVFTPAADSAGFVTTTGFAVAVTGPDGAASNGSITVTSVQPPQGLDAVPAGQVVISASPDGSSFAAATPGMTNEAVVTNPSSGATYTLPVGYQAAFLGGTADATLADPSVGNAWLIGNNGNDTIIAAAGNDTIVSGTGQNQLVASGLGDVVIAAQGTNTIFSTGDQQTVEAFGTAVVSSSGSGLLLFGGASVTGTMTVVATGANDTIAAGASTVNATVQGGQAFIFGGFGSVVGALNVVASGASDTITAGSSQTNITASGDNALVFGGFGASPAGLTVDLSGTGDTVSTGMSDAQVTTSGSNALVFGGFTSPAGSLSVVDQGTNDTIAAGNSAATVTAGDGSNGLLVLGSTASLNFVGSGTATVVAGGGPTSVSGGSGGLVYSALGSNSSVAGGAGGTTVFGGAGGAIDYTGSSGSLLYAAGSGNETLNAAGSSTDNTLIAGNGSAMMTGGSGSDAFIFIASMTSGAGGTDVIADFASNDAVSLVGYGANAAADALNTAVSDSGGTTITLSDNTKVTFLNLSDASSLAGHIFSV